MMGDNLQIPTEDAQAALRFCRSLARGMDRVRSKEESAASHARAVCDPELSLVIPVFNEAENVEILHSRLTDVLTGVGMSYEIIFVNDGSRDNGAEILQGLSGKDRHIVVLELSRNFGHQAAVSAGIDHARGNAVIVMDADLQDPPEVLPEFIAEWKNGFDVVYAIRRKRKEGWLKNNAYALFYRVLRWVSDIKIPLDAGDFCIMDRKVVDLMGSMPERNRFIRGIRSWVGFRQKGLAYERDKRYAGRPKYELYNLMGLALDGLLSFSRKPLRIASVLGLLVSLTATAMGICYILKKMTVGLNPPGFATTITAIFFLAGMNLLTLGVIGEYIGRIYDEVKKRPLYVVRRVWRRAEG